MFSCANFLIHKYRSRALDSIFVQTHAQLKKFRILNGVEPPNRHSGYASGFYLVQTTRDPGEQLR